MTAIQVLIILPLTTMPCSVSTKHAWYIKFHKYLQPKCKQIFPAQIRGSPKPCLTFPLQSSLMFSLKPFATNSETMLYEISIYMAVPSISACLQFSLPLKGKGQEYTLSLVFDKPGSDLNSNLTLICCAEMMMVMFGPQLWVGSLDFWEPKTKITFTSK